MTAIATRIDRRGHRLSAARRDQLAIGAAFALLLLGLAAWWRMALLPTITQAAELPILALWISGGAIVVTVAWLMNHRSGEGWSPLVATLTLAATAPLSMVPLVMSVGAGMVARAGLTLATLAVIPLVLDLAGRIARHDLARAARWIGLACVGFAAIAPIAMGGDRDDGYLWGGFRWLDAWAVRWLLLAAATLIPGLLAAFSTLNDPDVPLSSHARVVTAGIFAGTSVLPVVTGVALISGSGWPALVIPVAVALATAALLARVAIGPLARDAGSAAGQRDLVIEASESERTRLATALHDGPLGDVALLVQRLDAAGDLENAALARSIADELRDVGNDLRLPLVEDLGVGAGLEWLVERLVRTSGTPIGLSVAADGRPPVEAESAAYRIAQEALVNAIRHGAPPIDVRYESRPDRLRLTVSDGGTGIDANAPDRAVGQGRLGLLLMRHRSDSIDASLSVAAAPGGGTVVELRWPRPAR